MVFKVNLELNIEQVEALVERLPIENKIRLVKKLEKETWIRRLDETVGMIRKNFKKTHLSDQEITRICEESRQRMYEKRIKGNHR